MEGNFDQTHAQLSFCQKPYACDFILITSCSVYTCLLLLEYQVEHTGRYRIMFPLSSGILVVSPDPFPCEQVGSWHNTKTQ